MRYLINITLGIFLSVTPLNIHASHSSHKYEHPRWSELVQRYFPSVVLSALAGAATGTINGYLDKKIGVHFPLFPLWFIFSWSAEREIRASIIQSFISDMRDCDIPNKTELMYTCAWIASWITYLNY